ncbi:MAG: hypothetical protein GWP19_14605, partial [Planctomycetia bacterium]|nr:hypothetical protein [Planctomycetia bacterium]
MKQIKLPIRKTFIERFKLKDVLSQEKIQMPDGKMGHKIGTTKIDPNNPELIQAMENGAQIIFATINIEFKMQELITKYLFGNGCDNNNRRNFFSNEIMESNNVSYLFKKSLSL